MESKVIFVSGTDTDIGKTVAVGWLARNFAKNGKTVVTQKLIQTGCKGISEDIIMHRKIMGVNLLEVDENFTTCKYVLNFPSSPHIASEIDNVEIDTQAIAQNTRKLSSIFDITIVEGAGGLMVPIKKNLLTIDYIKENNLPLFLVVPSRLGSLNHALLSLEICLLRNINLEAVVYNTYPEVPKEIENSTRDFIKDFIAKNFPKAQFIQMGKVEF